MADDIVTRLYCSYADPPCESCTFCAARAEIERLRAEVAVRKAAFLHQKTSIEAQATEIRRLRAAGDALIATLVAVSVAGLPDDMDAFGAAVATDIAADKIERLQEVITDFVEAREALNKNEWCDDSGAFRSAYQDASRALEGEVRRG